MLQERPKIEKEPQQRIMPIELTALQKADYDNEQMMQ